MKKAYVLMNCNLGHEKDVISSLYQIGSVKEVHGLFGLYDVIAKLESEEKSIQKDLSEKIRKIPSITTTMTLMSTGDENIFEKINESHPVGLQMSQAYIVMYCEQGEEFSVLRSLAHIPEVIESDVLYGFYDVICKISASDYKELSKIITKKFRQLKNVRTTMTLQIIPEQETFPKLKAKLGN